MALRRFLGSVAILTVPALTPVYREDRPKMSAYRRVHAGDLVGGYVQPGEKVEVIGYLGVRRGTAWLKTNLPSAQAALPIDVSQLSSQTVQQIESRCAADNEALTLGGCWVRIRGRVTSRSKDRPGLAADMLAIIPPH